MPSWRREVEFHVLLRVVEAEQMARCEMRDLCTGAVKQRMLKVCGVRHTAADFRER
jgi:hypothetical protein